MSNLLDQQFRLNRLSIKRTLLLVLTVLAFMPVAASTVHSATEGDRLIESAAHVDHVHADQDEDTPAWYQASEESTPTEVSTSVASELSISDVEESSEDARGPPAVEGEGTPFSDNSDASQSSLDNESSIVTVDPTPALGDSSENIVIEPFAPLVSCTHHDGPLQPLAGSSAWSLYSCTLDWLIQDVEILRLAMTNVSRSGWEFIFLPDRNATNPSTEGVSELSLVIGEGGLESGSVIIGARAGCSAATYVELPIVATAVTSRSDEIAEFVIPISAVAPTTPEVTIQSAHFETVDVGVGENQSIGTLHLDYRNVPIGCGWSVSIAVTPFVLDDGVEIASHSLSLISVSEASFVETSLGPGALSFSMPGEETIPTSGTMTVTVSLNVPNTSPEGTYTGTITVDARGLGGVP
jgi:hypothetical protein